MPETYVGRFDGSNAAKTDSSKQDVNLSSAASSHLSTSTKWSVLSERIQGLLTEAQTIGGPAMEEYCIANSNFEGPAMQRIREKMMLETDWKQDWADGKTMFSYGEEMSTDPLEAQFLKAIAAMKQPKNILEIGMFTGYGAVAMLEGCADAKVTSLEIDPFLKTWVEEGLQAHESIASRLSILTGPALETLQNADMIPDESPKYDLVFVDANKSEYKRYVEILLERDLLADNCQILADNVLYCGIPYSNPQFDSQPARRAFGESIKEFNEWVKNHEKFSQVMLPLRDGVSVIMYRK